MPSDSQSTSRTAATADNYGLSTDLSEFTSFGSGLILLTYFLVVVVLIRTLISRPHLKNRWAIITLTFYIFLRGLCKANELAGLWSASNTTTASLNFLSGLTAILTAALVLPNLKDFLSETGTLKHTGKSERKVELSGLPPWFMNWLIAVFTALLALLTASHYIAGRINASSIRQTAIYKHVQRFQNLKNEIIDSTNHVRTFLVTGDRQELEKYKSSKKNVFEHLNKILNDCDQTEALCGEIAKLDLSCEKRFAILDSAVSQKLAGNDHAVQATLTSPQALANEEDLLSSYSALETMSNQQVLSEAEKSQNMGSIATYSTLAICIVLFVLFCIVLYALQRYSRQRRETEEALERSARQFDSLFLNRNQFSALLKPDGTVVEVNDDQMTLPCAGCDGSKDVKGGDNGAFSEIAVNKNISGAKIGDLFHWNNQDGLARLNESIKKAAAGELVRFEDSATCDSGAKHWNEIAVRPISDNKGQTEMLLFEMRDITALKKQQELLKEAQRDQERLHDLKMLSEALPQIIWTAGPDGQVDYQNHQWALWTGMPVSESLGNGWLKKILKEDHERVGADWRRAVHSGRPYSTEARMLDAEGKPFWVLVQATPLLDDEGEVIRWFGSCLNIEQQKMLTEKLEFKVSERTTEISKLNSELRRSNDELQQFAYAASHDLQEPLRAVAGYTGLLERRYASSLDATAIKYIRGACDGAMRMQTLISDLLSYARIQTRAKEFSDTDCRTVLDQVLKDSAESITESKSTVTISDLHPVYADATQLAQIFQNLISNAIKYRGVEGAEIHISSSLTEDGKMVQFCVQDKGIGIAPKDSNRIFEMFQRLHSRTEFPGTGIGLALCKRIVERHNGEIWVESEVGQGSRFYFTIPAADLPGADSGTSQESDGGMESDSSPEFDGSKESRTSPES